MRFVSNVTKKKLNLKGIDYDSIVRSKANSEQSAISSGISNQESNNTNIDENAKSSILKSLSSKHKLILVLGTFFSMAIGGFITGTTVAYVSETPGLYNQSCKHLCYKSLNLECINNICLCTSDRYYFNGCQEKVGFNKPCYGQTGYCQDQKNLVCKDGVCKCDNTDYWDGEKCQLKKSFGESCLQNAECSDNFMLHCDSNSNSSKCICEKNRYWDTTVCFPKKRYNEYCTSTISCTDELPLVCENSKCACDSKVAFWNGSTCVYYYTYKENCSSDNECKGLLSCNNGTGNCNCPDSVGNKLCDCPNSIGFEFYWNGQDCVPRLEINSSCYNNETSYMCKTLSQGTICSMKTLDSPNFVCKCPPLKFFNLSLQKCVDLLNINNSCDSHEQCRNDFGLLCFNKTCSCDSLVQFWNGIKCVNYFSYDESCSNDFECNGLLICNSGLSHCNCPLSINSGSCDCPNTLGNEYYWNGSICLSRLTFGSQCLGNYMCKLLSEGTICTGFQPNLICQCPTLQFYNVSSGKCENQLTINQTCLVDSNCRIDLGLICNDNLCLCNDTVQFWKENSCIDYYTYKDSCSADFECEGLLKCNNNGDICNCPDFLGQNVCDCPNTIGNEYYWNGLTCVPRRSFGDSCSGNNSSYMCRILSEGTLCTGFHFNFTCHCPILQYFNATLGKCVNRLLVNQTCASNTQCRYDLGLLCINSSCICNNTSQFWNGSRCINYFTYKDKCTNDFECDGVLICNDGITNCNCPLVSENKTCDCPNTVGNEYYWNGVDCIPRLTVNSACVSTNTSYICKILSQGTICDGFGTNFTCKCPVLEYFNTLSGKCENQLLHNSTCTFSSQCRNDLGLTCYSLCLCSSTTQFWNGNLCVDYFTYKNTCTNDFECDGHLICNNGTGNCNCPILSENKTCDCPNTIENEYYWDGIHCVPRLTINSECGDSYMCKTLSEGTICDISETGYICQCPQFQYFDLFLRKCKNQLSNNSTCSFSSQCRNDLGLTCLLSTCRCDSTTQFWNGSICIPYFTYRDSCKYDYECKGLLICNDGTQNCSCPLASVNKTCDCPNTIGNEYYWNGMNCVSRLAYNGSCLNSASSYMCKTLSEGTMCLLTGSKFTCQCPIMQYYNTATLKCENQLFHNQTCLLPLSCRFDLGLSCQSLKCLCNSTTQFWNGSMCINYLTYKDKCNNDIECNGVLICNNATSNCNCPLTLGNKTCDCPNTIGNEYYWNNVDCIPRVTIGNDCGNGSTGYMCKTLSEGTICGLTGAGYFCQCSSLQYFNTFSQKCVNRLNINQTCSFTTQCREDLGLLCVNSSCVCNASTQFWNGSSCINYLLVNASCASACQCTGLLYCSNGVCVCPRLAGFEFYWNGTDCAPSLPFGRPCYNSYTSEMCQMLTQGLICNGSGFNYTCQCPSPKSFNTGSNRCV